ncbi:MAG: sortase [Oscillospiraceae bacterium]|nr:sortase [Oscillospiraceae bacterium]
MKKTHAWCLIVIGAMLLIAALLLIVYNMRQDEGSGKESALILSDLRQHISQQQTEPPTTEPDLMQYIPTNDLFSEYATEETQETTEPADPLEDPVVEIDGSQYIGIISIPCLSVELPVMKDWSYPKLRRAPCRYQGNAVTGDLIIAAHNFRSHFGNIQSLNSGDQIVFLNADGEKYIYEVIQTDMVGGRDIPSMLAGSQDGWDLTLFTCTLSGQTRVAVRAVLIPPPEE